MDTFPLPSDATYHYTDEWSAKHQGTDIFASRGMPVVAVVAGRARAAEDPKGGHVVYLQGDDGRTYYYAHLDSRDPVLEEAGPLGVDVEAGAMLGGVGNSGNAAGTEPHLHFQISENGRAIDPFPELSELDPHQEPLPDLGVQDKIPNPPADLPQQQPQPASAAPAGGFGFAALLLAALWFVSRRRKGRRWST